MTDALERYVEEVAPGIVGKALQLTPRARAGAPNGDT